jgi:hypothetical protein
MRIRPKLFTPLFAAGSVAAALGSTNECGQSIAGELHHLEHWHNQMRVAGQC